MIGVCVICDGAGPVEMNHLAGRVNDPCTVVPFCLRCHWLFTPRQWGAGVSLDDGPRHVVDRLRGLVIGVAASLELFCYRRRSFVKCPPEMWRLVGRLLSWLLDHAAEPDRGGRQLPNARWIWETAVWELPPRRDFEEHLDDFCDQLGFAIVQSLKTIEADQ